MVLIRFRYRQVHDLRQLQSHKLLKVPFNYLIYHDVIRTTNEIGSLLTNLVVVEAFVEQHIQDALLIGIADGMSAQILDYRRVVELSHVDLTGPLVAASNLRRRHNDGVHCEDFIDPRHDDVINSVIKQSLIQIEYARRCHFNQPIQKFVYRSRRPAFVAVQTRHI